MWMLRPSSQPREVTIDLPPLLVESLGVGAEVLANHLTVLAEVGYSDPANHPPPMPVLCRICERQITPWWFEKHSELCLQEHRAEMDVQMAQENLNEHRNAIVKVLDALEARKSRSQTGETSTSPTPEASYKGLQIGPSTSSTPSSGLASGTVSAPGTPPGSRDQSASGFGHSRGRSFAVRRPLARIVELVLDLCDTALEISTPALKEARTEFGDEVRTQSPQSESRISQVLQWQSPSSNTLDQEEGLSALSADTERLSKAKVDAVLRHRRIVEYSERIRIEFTVLVEECISAAMTKAERIAAGELSDTSSSTDGGQQADNSDKSEPVPISQGPKAPRSTTSESSGTSAMATALRNTSDQSLNTRSERRPSSVTTSTRSSSPMECPTPRSRKSAAGLLGHSHPSKRGSLLAESDAGDSDSSIPSSVIAGSKRTESPSSERSLGRAASARDRKRKSLILPGISSSPHRQRSPGRSGPAPQSPLRLSKPRLPSGETMPSPSTSPLLTTGDFMVHGSHQHSGSHHHHHHHRRQSSTASSSEFAKPPVSPRLTTASHPPPRALAPSIKDFEIIKPISKGAFGSVYLSKKKSTAEYFAIKVLKKADMVAKNQITNVKAERAIMMWQGESDFVAKLYWTFSSKDYLYLVMEYLNGGDCASLVKILGGLPEDWAKKYIAEVILGVEHLHSRGIVHRDLKPDNLLIDQKGHLKLTDFGLSRMGLVGRQKRVLKSPNESAPDLLKQGPFTRGTSLASSRSASFDLQGGNSSPNSTPVITPDLGGILNQPSYFNLSGERERPGISREPSRRRSGHRSDSGGSDALNNMFRNMTVHEGGEPIPIPNPHQAGIEEEAPPSEASDSPHLYPLQPSTSYSAASSSVPHSTPPQQQSMLPPPMALFDPEDHNRRFVGTPDYLAPETINGVGQDEMSDWWSLGCILFEFLLGYPPFNADTPDQVFENILNRRINWPDEAEELVSPEAMDLMNKLMVINPEERLGANVSEKYPSGGAEVRSHPWFSDINWDTLLEDEAQFVPAPENPEDTEYFDARGATLQAFTEELEDQPSSGSGGDYPDRPHDALSKVRTQVNSLKRNLMPLHIPPHVRDTRSRRLSEPAIADDFGNFNFKNLPVLERANKDVIQKLRQEAMQAQQRPPTSVTAPTSATSGPSLEGSPLLPMPLQRTMSQSKNSNRPSSPSSLSQANSSSPSRPSQPSSPLMVQFSTGQNHERRKTSGSSTFSTSGPQSTSSLQPSGYFEPPPRLSTNFKAASSAASSPIKTRGVTSQSPEKSTSRQSSVPCRSRSQTVGSQDSEFQPPAKEPFVPGHHKRRSQLLDISPSSSDNEDPRAKALLKVQRRRQSSRRLSQINLNEGPYFRPLDVLICEDHPVSRMVMERLFEKLRCRTITAANGSEAVRYTMSEVQFDIIMTEFKLPQINGADIARMVRDTKSANTNTPIIAVTGYLKDLPETHNFDALIEKPPTLAKLTETLCRFCQWKPPPKDFTPSQPMAIPPPTMRQMPSSTMDSPGSMSSGFPPVSGSSYRGSSREDSVGSGYFGDLEPSKTDDIPVVISRQNTEEWPAGLGISEETAHLGSSDSKSPPMASMGPPAPHLLSATSAPPTTGARNFPKRRSIEGIRAKRESLQKKRYEGAESGDDEDEELGDAQVRSRSPNSGKVTRSGSKLGTEMMRTNSRGSVVSGSEELLKMEREMMEKGGEKDGGGRAISPVVDHIQEKMERLHIPEDALETLPEDSEKEKDDKPVPTSSSHLKRDKALPEPPPFPCYETEVYSPPHPRPQMLDEAQTKPESSTLGQFTPPTGLSKNPRAAHGDDGAVTGSTGEEPGLGVEEDTDADATPKPVATPAIDRDSDPTPRARQPDKDSDDFVLGPGVTMRERISAWRRR